MAIIIPEQLQGIYEDVALLQSQVAQLQSDVTTIQSTVNDLRVTDTGWLTLPLNTGVSVHNPTFFPCMYRKIGNKVYVKGCVTGFSEVEKVIAVLPEGFRPAQSFYIQRATSAGRTNTLNVRTNGNIERLTTNLDQTNASDYHFIDVEFLVD